MVFDIGGGSTEFAVGSGDQTNFLSSVILGCNTCSYLFAHQITWIAFSHAELIVRKAIRVVIKDLKSTRFDNCVGTSGTAKDISELGECLGFGPVITKESIERCKRYLVEGNHFKSDNYFGLTVEPISRRVSQYSPLLCLNSNCQRFTTWMLRSEKVSCITCITAELLNHRVFLLADVSIIIREAISCSSNSLYEI